jgi:N-sulfoglucosamine sulfohydrolase
VVVFLRNVDEVPSEMEKPNILYIHSHDTGRYVQPYGHAVATPNIQQLAEQGILFRKAFSVAPTCSPSRAGLLTGQCAHSAGMLGLVNRGFRMAGFSKHIVNTLRQAGYYSALIGLQHIAADPHNIGYDTIVRADSNRIAHVAPIAVEFLSSSPPSPFFLAVGCSETHRAFHPATEVEDPRYCLPPHPIPDAPETRKDVADYKASARVMDTGMGAVFGALERNGLDANTLVICTTDHGISFPAMKCNLTDHGTGVMLIIRGPGGFIGGRVCDAMVSHIDLFPTICDLSGIECPSWLQGQSLLPLVREEVREIHHEITAEVTYHAAYEPQRSVRTTRWKYIRRFDNSKAFIPNCDDGYSKDFWLRHGWRDNPVTTEELYDLTYDPNEMHNLHTEPALVDVLQNMRLRLQRWMERTHDPLLEGDVPLPKGAIVSHPDDLSHQDLWRRMRKPPGYA